MQMHRKTMNLEKSKRLIIYGGSRFESETVRNSPEAYPRFGNSKKNQTYTIGACKIL
jgi:hypothetical protein